MGLATAVFPAAIWDGDSASRSAPDADRRPDYRDYDQCIAEVAAVQDYVLNGPSAAVGAAGSGVTATESVQQVKKTVITLTAEALTTTDEATHGAFTSQKLYDFPEGNILIHGAIASIALAAGSGGLTDTAAIVAGVGTAVAAESAGDGTLATAENNIIPSTAYTLSGGVKAATKAVSTAQLITDGTAGAKSAYLNFQVPTAGSSATDTLTVTGTVTIYWQHLGDA